MTPSKRGDALEALGYSRPEAEFLALVSVHSGYFLRRQYEASAQVGRGASSVRFLQRAVAAGHVRSTTYSNRTEVFHLFARAIYRAIGEEDNRNRRRRPVYSIKAKLMALDFVLAHRDSVFLATEAEKLDHFCGKLGIPQDRLPKKTYGARAPDKTRRYFVEKYPIFLRESESAAPSLTTPTFCYVDEGVLSTSGLTTFLHRYRRLFVALRRFDLVYIAAEHRPFRRAWLAFDRFVDSLARPESMALPGEVGEYFRLRRLLETRQYRFLDKAKLDQLRELSAQFRRPKVESRYREWTEEMRVADERGPVTARFKPYFLQRSYAIFG